MVRFDRPSQYGIRQGRISKLWITDAIGERVINYDRGWDKRPDNETANPLLNAIIAKFN